MFHRWWPCPDCAITQRSLRVSRFTTAAMTDADVDRIMADASTALQTDDGPGDTACPVHLARNGAVTTFATGDGSIDSQDEFNAVIGLPGEVKIVNAINYCGALIPNVIGCAPVPGASLAIVRYAADQEGLLLAHEFGHNNGLSHRNDDANAIMNGVIGPTRRRVNTAECAAYRNQPALSAATSGVVMAADQPAGELMDIKDFVRQGFVEGVPYEQASRYPASVVPTLVEMLNDPAEQYFWANIAVTLGMIGDNGVVQPLIDFIEKGDGETLAQPVYRAKTAAVMSLGYVVNKSGNRQALDYLKSGLKPADWGARLAPALPSSHATLPERNQDFSKYAVLGLGLAGTPEAADALRSMQPPESATPGFAAEVDSLADQALRENQTIQSKGLNGYYRSSE